MAGKLITPVQYEPVLDDLNQIRPLQLQDDVQRVISLPVVNTNPANNPNNARGKFLRCSQQGVILGTHNYNSYDYEEIEKYIIDDFSDYLITFSQLVKFVQVEIRQMADSGYLRWRTLYPSRLIIIYENTGFYYWPYRGTQLNVRINGTGNGGTQVFFRGFY